MIKKSRKEKIIQVCAGTEINPNPILLTSYGRVLATVREGTDPTDGRFYSCHWQDITPAIEKIK